MGQLLTHASQLDEDESVGEFDIYNPNHYDKCVYEKDLETRGFRVIMSQELYQKILDYSHHEISNWVHRRIGPSSTRRVELVPITIHLSWILQRNTLDWAVRRLYNEMTKLHPGFFPVYDVPVLKEKTPIPSIYDNQDNIYIRGPSEYNLTVLMSGDFYHVILKWYEETLKHWYRCNQTVPIWNFENQDKYIIRVSLSWILETDTMNWKVEKIHQETGKLFPNVRFLKL